MTTGENAPPRRLILQSGSSLDLSTASYTSERLRLVPPTTEFGDEIFKEFTKVIEEKKVTSMSGNELDEVVFFIAAR